MVNKVRRGHLQILTFASAHSPNGWTPGTWTVHRALTLDMPPSGLYLHACNYGYQRRWCRLCTDCPQRATPLHSHRPNWRHSISRNPGPIWKDSINGGYRMIVQLLTSLICPCPRPTYADLCPKSSIHCAPQNSSSGSFLGTWDTGRRYRQCHQPCLVV